MRGGPTRRTVISGRPETTGSSGGRMSGNAVTRFLPGQSGNPAGRPKGSRHRISEAFLRALADDFEAHGAGVIQHVRERDPAAYLNVVARVLPRLQGDEECAPVVVTIRWARSDRD